MAQILSFYNEIIQPPPQNLHRDYLQGRLYKKLIVGTQYCVTFWACAEEGSSYDIKELSAYLDNGTIDTTKTSGQPQVKYTPQVTYNGGIITDTMHWTKIEGSFIAKGNEQFITIGNFNDKAHTTWLYTPVNKITYDSTAYGWYLIDDVSVIASDTKADAGPDTHVGRGDSVFIGRPNEIGLECSWNVLGSSTVIGNGAGIWVKPNATTSYVVTQTLCGVVTKDTVKVEVWAAGVQSINGQTQQYGIVPNPNNGAFELVQSIVKEEQVTISVLNAMGQKVYCAKASFRNGRASISGDSLPAGLYYLSLKTGGGICMEYALCQTVMRNVCDHNLLRPGTEWQRQSRCFLK